MNPSIRTWLSMFLASSLLACVETPMIPQASQQQPIENRYAQAQRLYKQKLAPLAQYFAKTCAPMPDDEYLRCIDAKRGEIEALSIYPESAAVASQRRLLEQRLLSGVINRKQFRAGLEQIHADEEARQLQRDFAEGVYHGRY